MREFLVKRNLHPDETVFEKAMELHGLSSDKRHWEALSVDERNDWMKVAKQCLDVDLMQPLPTDVKIGSMTFHKGQPLMHLLVYAAGLSERLKDPSSTAV